MTSCYSQLVCNNNTNNNTEKVKIFNFNCLYSSIYWDACVRDLQG